MANVGERRETMAELEAQTATQLKEAGNAAFEKSDFEAADRHYSDAIAKDPTLHAIWSNRSATRLKLEQHAAALADAEECIRLKPDWCKGYHRKAQALKAMGDDIGAFETYVTAKEIVPKASADFSWLVKETKRTEKEMRAGLPTRPVSSMDQMVATYCHMDGTWDRLSTLAYFWNAASPEERRSIFERFLAINSGASEATSIDDYGLDQMMALPTDNYDEAGKPPVQVWMDFYTTLESTDKVSLFERLWISTVDAEKQIIYKDLQHFFLQPIIDRRDNLNPAADEEEEEAPGAVEEVKE